jgi:hypothetical protein
MVALRSRRAARANARHQLVEDARLTNANGL